MEERGTLFLIELYELVNVEGLIEIDNQHLVVIIVVADTGRNLQ